MEPFEELGDALKPAGEAFGFVDYDALLPEDSPAAQALARNVRRVAEARPEGWDAARRKAFLLNAYNVLSLSAAVGRMRGNPRWEGNTSFFGRVRFFFLAKHDVGGRRMSLYALENSVIRREFADDPRVHCYLNCCSLSCPRLSRRWLDGSDPAAADALLAEASASFVGPQGGARPLDGGARLSLSSIFKWYKKDFGGDPAAFARAHGGEALAGVADDPALEFQHYDWRPNSARLAGEQGLLDGGARV